MNKSYILTVANKSKYYYPYLIKSVNNNNNKLITLGFNKEWIGFNTKFKLMFNAINNFNDDDIICFVDGFDVICVRDLNELTNIFLEIKKREKCNIIVGYDNNVKDIFTKIFASLYFTKKINSTVINSGTYIGFVKDIRKFLSFVLSIDNDELADDQILMNKYNKLNPYEIYIDINTEMFLTIVNPLQSIEKYTEIKEKVVYSNKNKPFFIHAAGSGFMNDILQKLDYKIDTNIELNLKKDFLKKNFIIYRDRFIKNINKYKYKILFIIIFTLLFYIKD
jgi:hypothetical protein